MGGFTRAFVGAGYRDLWTTPIKVPIAAMTPNWRTGAMSHEAMARNPAIVVMDVKKQGGNNSYSTRVQGTLEDAEGNMYKVVANK